MNERLIEIHKNMTSEGIFISGLLQQFFNRFSYARVIEGESNEVYFVQTEEGSFYLKISHREVDNFGRERAASRLASSQIRVAKNFKIGEYEGKFFSISESIDGISLHKSFSQNDLNNKQLKSLCALAGETLARLHRVRTPGFDILNEKGEGILSSEKESLELRFHKYKSEESFAKLGIPLTLLDAAVTKIFNNLNILETGYLVHMDYNPTNVLIDYSGQEIVGVLDFEWARSSDPVFDLFNWSYLYPDDLFYKEFLSAYEGINKLNNLKPRLELVWFCQFLFLIDYYMNLKPDPDSLNQVVHAFKKLLDNTILD